MKTSPLLRQEAERIWRAGVDAVRPQRLLEPLVQRHGDTLRLADQTFRLSLLSSLTVFGAGKAAAAMAKALESLLEAASIPQSFLQGWIHVLEEQAEPERKPLSLIPVRPAGNPEPTEAGVQASHTLLRLCKKLQPSDLALCLLSGGASAMMPLPAEGLTLADKQSAIRALSKAGAPISEINAVRKHLSRIKGGQLAASCSAGALVTFALSDVIGNSLEVIGSGPTVPDSTTFAEAMAILRKYRLWNSIPSTIQRHLERGTMGLIPETPKTLPQTVRAHRIGDNSTACAAAASAASARGYDVVHWPDPLQGEARLAGKALIRWFLETLRRNSSRPLCGIAGGETVVSNIVPAGRGGRCQELILGAYEETKHRSLKGLCLLAAGTDGEDGPTDAAGAFLDEEVRQNARRLNLAPQAFWTTSRSYDFCLQTGALFKTGPTSTNVMDLLVLVSHPALP